MREIEFRGISKESGEWVYGYYCEGINNSLICFQEQTNPTWNEPLGDSIMIHEAVIQKSIGQYTGLKDKNGVKIFEGDIIQTGSSEVWLISYHAERNPHQAMQKIQIGKVSYVGTSFVFITDNYSDGYPLSTLLLHENRGGLLVVGNIHQNPELLNP